MKKLSNQHPDSVTSKAIVVLGAAMWADGPSPTLRRRCGHAAALWQTGAFDGIVVCGGLGRHSPTEAAAMAQLLTDFGVARKHIQLEDTSTNTLENLQRAAPILAQRNYRQITIVTDSYHGPRAWLVARMIGLSANVSNPSMRGTHLPTQIKQHLRELFALPAYAARLICMRMRGRF